MVRAVNCDVCDVGGLSYWRAFPYHVLHRRISNLDRSVCMCCYSRSSSIRPKSYMERQVNLESRKRKEEGQSTASKSMQAGMQKGTDDEEAVGGRCNLKSWGS